MVGLELINRLSSYHHLAKMVVMRLSGEWFVSLLYWLHGCIANGLKEDDMTIAT